MKKADVSRFFERLAARIEAPTTELDYRNPYTLLVAVVLSAQATDKGVNKATKPLFAEVETPAEMLALGEARLKEQIKTIGLFNTKAKNVIALSKALVEKHDGGVPNDRAALEALPGCRPQDRECGSQHGLRRAYHRRRYPHLPAVEPQRARAGQDTARGRGRPHPHRARPLQAARAPLADLHGRYVCKARAPDCPACAVRDLCRYKAKTI